MLPVRLHDYLLSDPVNPEIREKKPRNLSKNFVVSIKLPSCFYLKEVQFMVCFLIIREIQRKTAVVLPRIDAKQITEKDKTADASSTKHNENLTKSDPGCAKKLKKNKESSITGKPKENVNSHYKKAAYSRRQ
jgi:hypothetical protein